MTEVKRGMEEAQRYLDVADALVKKSLVWIKGQCAGGKGLSGDKLDEHQVASFDLAWCEAEITGARFAIEYAGRVADKAHASSADASLEGQMTLMFCAEALQNTRNRLWARPQNFGLNDADIATLLTADISHFCQKQMDANTLSALGTRVLNGAEGDYLLGDDALMMQDSFRKLATNVVAPLAEKIHREDLVIPQEILQPLTEMGCFGLSIPERFGGIQSNDHEGQHGHDCGHRRVVARFPWRCGQPDHTPGNSQPCPAQGWH
jgi:(2S)-methylsuccinyl-CoA dehydrogenase